MACMSTEDEKINKSINDMLKKQASTANNIVKLLLLGTGESGKTTFLKQLKIIHSTGFNERDRKSYKCLVFSNVSSCICDMIEATTSLPNAISIAAENLGYLNKMQAFLLQSDIDSIDIYATELKALWKDPAIQHVFKRANELQLLDSTEYWFQHIDRITEQNYMPTVDDVLRVRIMTTGVTEVQMEIKNTVWSIVDVGGQRTERRKWLHCFEGVNSIIFFISLNEYDQKLREDNVTNRMSEALKLWEDISNYKLFVDSGTALILFLNKKDLFKKKSYLRYHSQYFSKNFQVPMTTILLANISGRNF